MLEEDLRLEKIRRLQRGSNPGDDHRVHTNLIKTNINDELYSLGD